jgi:hypothetical protein
MDQSNVLNKVLEQHKVLELCNQYPDIVINNLELLLELMQKIRHPNHTIPSSMIEESKSYLKREICINVRVFSFRNQIGTFQVV